MNTRVAILALILLSGSVFGKIRNGYEHEIQAYNDSLQNLRLRLSEHQRLATGGAGRLKREIKNLINLISYWRLTDQLIEQLRIVSPDIYSELENVKDKRGRSMDIVVRLIAKENARIQLAAVSFFTQSMKDNDAITSVYGDYSVAVDVWLTDQSLFLLCHELGHLSYVIPNAADYFRFYDKFYRARLPNLSYIGHNRFDESGKSAKAFEKRFRHDHAEYSKTWNKRPESAYVLMQRIRQDNKRLELIDAPHPIVYNTSIK